MNGVASGWPAYRSPQAPSTSSSRPVCTAVVSWPTEGAACQTAAMPSSGVARNTGLALLTQIVTAAFTAALTIFLVRRLGPDDYGLFSLALGIAGLVMLPADFGIAQSAGRFIAERRSDRGALADILAHATRLKVLSGAAVAVALF